MMQKARGGLNFSSNCSSFFVEVRNGVRRSILQLRGRSEAAALPSEPPRPRKRVSLGDRRAMIESYVSRYRSKNAGKFPTATTIRKEVGGSYYVARRVVQELEYNSKVRSPNTKEGSLSMEGAVTDVELMTEDEVASTVSDTKEKLHTVIFEDIQMNEISDKQVEDAGGSQADTRLENMLPHGVLDSNTKIGSLSMEGFVKDEELMSEGEVASTVSETKEELHTIVVEDIQINEMSDKKVEDAGRSQADKKSENMLPDGVFDSKTLSFHHVFDLEERTLRRGDDGSWNSKVDVICGPCGPNADETQGIQEDNLNNCVRHSPPLDTKIEVSDESLPKPEHLETIESQGDKSDFSALESHLVKEVSGNGNINDAQKEDSTSENLPTTHFAQEEKRAIELSSDAEHTRKSSLLGKLKSFADGVISIWRKL